jgi:hypothetical protein
LATEAGEPLIDTFTSAAAWVGKQMQAAKATLNARSADKEFFIGIMPTNHDQRGFDL